MAPQQNSTLIDENLDVSPSLINIPEEISHYSPILPPKNKHNHDKDNKNNNNNTKRDDVIGNNNNNISGHQQDVNFVRNWEQMEGDKGHYHKNKHHRSGSYRSGHSRRSRSISLYGVNSTIKQGHKEITIWLGDEPRYVSGVTNKTSCNDIIKALIDDEIRCGNYEYCQRLKDGTASRDYSDYVITECWRGIERSYDGNMAILPVWNAWSRVHNEIRLSLKHSRDILDPSKAFKNNNTTLSIIRNYICKFLTFGKRKPYKTKKTPKYSNNSQKHKSNQNSQKADVIPNIIPLADCQRDFQKPNSNIMPKQEESNLRAKSKTNKEKLFRLSEARSSQRKRRSSHKRKEKRLSIDKLSNVDAGTNYLRRRKDSSIRNSVRSKLAQKNAEMNSLYEREYALTKQLANKCKLYKLQNELYRDPDNDLDISVGQIQHNIEAYAREIIRTEHELLEVKKEIKNDISIINNLKRLTLESDRNECGVPVNLQEVLKPEIHPDPKASTSVHDPTSDQMLFVDNIYEFCDNNASMLV
ncbi:ras association domain-containing protein 10 [Stomoxys calcitrans]|uniref:ras association domain-containing protein 10 n=1 Tax=Stomoxys calcitrans TaxID=35570 RepID=UPI0027E30790|nr:ras association domain-containing protein 10 [Stomoxys calcitrans]